MSTIFAPITGAGRVAVTAVRISGPAAGRILAGLCGGLPEPRLAALRRLRDAAGEVLDQAMVVWMPGPGSFTGEDVAELHLHGGPAVLEGVAEALRAAGARFAEPGEFSRRAFLNGRMDLIQAEAVADLVDAETAGQRRQALRQLGGALGALYEGWSARLAMILAQQEALIDFPDEDLPASVAESLRAESAALCAEIAAHLGAPPVGERLREGLVFAVRGAPNVGKSTLVNALAGREAAIVSPIPGTTRDVLEIPLILGDAPVTLIDTAGLRETDDPVEREGVRRARARLARADLILDLVGPGDRAAAPAAGGETELAEAARLVIGTKRDIGPPGMAVDLAISVPTGAGMAALREALVAAARQATRAGGAPPLTRQRHRALVAEAQSHLIRAEGETAPELQAEAWRAAMVALGGLTGRIGVEDLLDRIFSSFCIGK